MPVPYHRQRQPLDGLAASQQVIGGLYQVGLPRARWASLRSAERDASQPGSLSGIFEGMPLRNQPLGPQAHLDCPYSE